MVIFDGELLEGVQFNENNLKVDAGDVNKLAANLCDIVHSDG